MAQQVFAGDETKETAKKFNIRPSGASGQRAPTFLGGNIDQATGNLILGSVTQTSQGQTVTPSKPITNIRDIVVEKPAAAPAPAPEPKAPDPIEWPGGWSSSGKGGYGLSNYAVGLAQRDVFGNGGYVSPSMASMYHADRTMRFNEQPRDLQLKGLELYSKNNGIPMTTLLSRVTLGDGIK